MQRLTHSNAQERAVHKKTRVSVVLIAHDIAEKIEVCVDSVLNQNFDNYEVIVVDDGSTDNTAEKVAKYPVRLVRQKNEGVPAARNAGARVSRGDAIIFLDGDCVVLNDFIEKMVGPFENPKIGMTQGYIDIANPESLVARLIFIKARYIFQKLEYLDFAWGGCIAVRRSLFRQLGGFSTRWRRSEDKELSRQLLKQDYTIYLVKEARFLHPFVESLFKHLSRHARTAREMTRWVISTKRYTTQHTNLTEYFRLIVHGLTLLSLLIIPWSWLPFLILLVTSLATHLKLAWWAMGKDLKYILIIPFEFLTKLSWVFGSVVGLRDLLLRKEPYCEIDSS